jgi:hypothetical protein
LPLEGSSEVPQLTSCWTFRRHTNMLHADHVAPLYPQKLALTSPTSVCLSVGMVRSRTQATEFSFTNSSDWWGVYLLGSNAMFSVERIARFPVLN